MLTKTLRTLAVLTTVALTTTAAQAAVPTPRAIDASRFELVNSELNVCLEWNGDHDVAVYGCSSSPGQRWYSPDHVTIRSSVTGACLASADYEEVVLADCDGSRSQKWNEERQGLVNDGDGHCLTVERGWVIMARCGVTSGQTWDFVQ